MKVPILLLALRAELSKARASSSEDRLALFVLNLEDDGDLPAWELATDLLPGQVPKPGDGAEHAQSVLFGAAPVSQLVRSLHRAGERELSAALRASPPASVPVVCVQDVVRKVTFLEAVEAEEIESLLHTRPIGQA